MNHQYIIIHACSNEQAKFFLRFVKSGNQYGYYFMIITYTYSVYRYLTKYLSGNNKAVYLKRRHLRYKSYVSNSYFEKDLECMSGYVSLSDANRAYTAAINFLEHLGVNNISYIWCWNGCKIVDHALADFAHNYHIKTLFFEIANIDGKIFVDPDGTNCHSLLYKNKEVLKRFTVDESIYNVWKKEYIYNKFRQVTIKQAISISSRKLFLDYLTDCFGFLFQGGVVKRRFPVNSIKKKLTHTSYGFANVDFTQINYVFFPLQVSTDTQILINGNLSLLAAITRVLHYAQEKDLYLVIKPHPADKNPLYLHKMKQLLSTYRKTIFSNENTFKLLKNAKEVFTINSTVGLEAMILNCPVHVFGKALYENFTEDDIKRYIWGYLYNIDYWGNKDISQEDFEHIILRAELN